MKNIEYRYNNIQCWQWAEEYLLKNGFAYDSEYKI